MKIIDFHSHIDDILYGGEIIEPYPDYVWTPGDIFERSSYRIAGMKGPLEQVSRILEVLYIHHRIQVGTLENMKRFMSKYGVEKSVLLPISPHTEALEYLNKVKADERFIVFASVSPKDPDKERKLKEQMAQGCRGLKLHPVLQNAPPDHPGYFEILEIFRTYKMPVLFHSGIVSYYPAYQPVRSGYGEPLKFEKIIQAFPDIPIVMGHCGMRQGEQVMELARKYENVYGDSSNQPLKTLRKMASVLGKDRLLFGSDWPTSHQITPIKIGLKLTQGDTEFQEKFFFKNAINLLNEKS